MSGRIRMITLLAVAALAVVGGALALVWSLLQPVSLGFFAYAPESGETFTTPGVHILATGSLVAAGVLALGLVGLAFWAGIRVGGRRARHEPDAS
ncbi:hypothetical protein DOU15_05345 [Clavibacter michiganensis subsp. michiganensis]|uniref:hypothetical protein n=1 Tax=Clavibacter michiganensis TaxID=28447 RepID=UPI00136528A4|nr:hypothetical protein [Clavibacter michiganensis]MWJ15315.1 hypothetical protein [Clavibacter michiganensis subsp. michiganensis]